MSLLGIILYQSRKIYILLETSFNISLRIILEGRTHKTSNSHKTMYISQKRPYLYSIQKKKKEKGRKRVKKVPSSEKTFGNYVSDKRVIPKIQHTKNSYHLIAKKKKSD